MSQRTTCWNQKWLVHKSFAILADDISKISSWRKWENSDSNFTEICSHTVYPKKYAHGFCFAVLCCGYTLTDFPISIKLTSLALWQYNDCPNASKATLMNMDKYFMWIHYERLHNHNKAKHKKIVCILFGIYCKSNWRHDIFLTNDGPIDWHVCVAIGGDPLTYPYASRFFMIN